MAETVEGRYVTLRHTSHTISHNGGAHHAKRIPVIDAILHSAGQVGGAVAYWRRQGQSAKIVSTVRWDKGNTFVFRVFLPGDPSTIFQEYGVTIPLPQNLSIPPFQLLLDQAAAAVSHFDERAVKDFLDVEVPALEELLQTNRDETHQKWLDVVAEENLRPDEILTLNPLEQQRHLRVQWRCHMEFGQTDVGGWVPLSSLAEGRRIATGETARAVAKMYERWRELGFVEYRRVGSEKFYRATGLEYACELSLDAVVILNNMIPMIDDDQSEDGEDESIDQFEPWRILQALRELITVGAIQEINQAGRSHVLFPAREYVYYLTEYPISGLSQKVEECCSMSWDLSQILIRLFPDKEGLISSQKQYIALCQSERELVKEAEEIEKKLIELQKRKKTLAGELHSVRERKAKAERFIC